MGRASANGASARKVPGARASVKRGPREPAAAPAGGAGPLAGRTPGIAGPGGDPPEPPAALRAARWYFADTPALAEAFGPGSLAGNERLAVTRRGPRRQHRGPNVLLSREMAGKGTKAARKTNLNLRNAFVLSVTGHRHGQRPSHISALMGCGPYYGRFAPR
jgi:hypothetical protein